MNLTGENTAFESPDSGLQESGFSAMMKILSDRQGKHMTASAKARDIRFGNKLTALRQSRGLTQEFVAMKLKVSDGAVSKWETGASKPKAGRAAELAKLLGVDIDTLLDDDVMTPAEAEQMKAEQRQAIFKKVQKRLVENYGSNLNPYLYSSYYSDVGDFYFSYADVERTSFFNGPSYTLLYAGPCFVIGGDLDSRLSIDASFGLGLLACVQYRPLTWIFAVQSLPRLNLFLPVV